MKAKALDPIVSEFSTEEDAADYDRWLREKVRASLEDGRPSVPHDEAMARVNATLEAARRRRGTG